MSLAFHHHAILVSDLERAEMFYEDVLGLEVKKRWFDDVGQPRSIWFALGGESFLAVELRVGTSRPDFGHHCFALGIPKSERGEWLARLRAAGVAIEKLSDFTIYVRDPEDNQIALSHWPEPAKHPKPPE